MCNSRKVSGAGRRLIHLRALPRGRETAMERGSLEGYNGIAVLVTHVRCRHKVLGPVAVLAEVLDRHTMLGSRIIGRFDQGMEMDALPH